MSSLDKAIEIERHNCEMSRLGLFPERLEQSERRLIELYTERERQHAEYLRAGEILDRMTAPKGEPLCLWPMGPDQYFDGRGELRQEKASPFHH